MVCSIKIRIGDILLRSRARCHPILKVDLAGGIKEVRLRGYEPRYQHCDESALSRCREQVVHVVKRVEVLEAQGSPR